MTLFTEIKTLVDEYNGKMKSEKTALEGIKKAGIYSDDYYTENKTRSDKKMETAKTILKQNIKELVLKYIKDWNKQEQESFKLSDIEVQNELTTLSIIRDTISREELQDFYNRLHVHPQLSLVISSIAKQRRYTLLPVLSLAEQGIEDYHAELKKNIDALSAQYGTNWIDNNNFFVYAYRVFAQEFGQSDHSGSGLAPMTM